MPDFLCLAKGHLRRDICRWPPPWTQTSGSLTGLPVAEVEETKRPSFHGHTYTGNPLACAAALASLDLLAENDTVGRLAPLIETMAEALVPVARRPHVVEVRQQGLMVGVELAADKEADTPYEPGQRMGHRVIMAARRLGVIIRPLGDTVILMPPLSSTVEEIRHLVEALDQAIAEVTER